MFSVTPSGDLQVTLRRCLCLKAVLVIYRSFSLQKLISLSPLPFSRPWPCGPITSLRSIWSLPVIALKSPMTMSISFFGVWSVTLWSWKKNCLHYSSLRAESVAYTWMMVRFDTDLFSLMVAILSDTGVKEISAFFVVGERMNPTPCLWVPSVRPESRREVPEIVSSLVRGRCVSDSPNKCHLYRSSSLSSRSIFPGLAGVWVLSVPMLSTVLVEMSRTVSSSRPGVVIGLLWSSASPYAVACSSVSPYAVACSSASPYAVVCSILLPFAIIIIIIKLLGSSVSPDAVVILLWFIEPIIHLLKGEVSRLVRTCRGRCSSLNHPPFRSCPPEEDPPTMIICHTIRFYPLLGEGLKLTGHIHTPVGPAQSTSEGPSSSSAWIYVPQARVSQLYFRTPRGWIPPWSAPPSPPEVPCISTRLSPICYLGTRWVAWGGPLLRRWLSRYSAMFEKRLELQVCFFYIRFL